MQIPWQPESTYIVPVAEKDALPHASEGSRWLGKYHQIWLSHNDMGPKFMAQTVCVLLGKLTCDCKPTASQEPIGCSRVSPTSFRGACPIKYFGISSGQSSSFRGHCHQHHAIRCMAWASMSWMAQGAKHQDFPHQREFDPQSDWLCSKSLGAQADGGLDLVFVFHLNL